VNASAISAREGYELWAETWDDTPSPIVALEERMLRPWIEQVQARRAVDVGCGTGRWTGRLNALGFDASTAMLALAAKKPGLRGRVAVADAVALPVASGSADLVLCALTLGHVRGQSAVFEEFARVLEPGGTLLLTDFHPAAAAHGWRRTFRHGGRVFELENYPYRIEELGAVALRLDGRIDAAIGEPERKPFEQAGRPELFDAAWGIPAVLLTRWTRV
jgi:malonyl-CoA O-methyltransferase